MNAGQLRHRVVIESRTGTQDSVGQPIDDWSVFAELWAAVEPLTGRELFSAQQVNAETTTRVRMRYREGLDTSMRIVHHGINYNILNIIDPEMRHIELQLLCSIGLVDV